MNTLEYPKILFITVNGWNNTTGTSTISSIINGYPTDKIANIKVMIPNAGHINAESGYDTFEDIVEYLF